MQKDFTRNADCKTIMTAKLAKEKKKMKTLTLGSWVAFWNSFCQACFFTSSRKEMASTQMLLLISFNAEQKLKHWCPATSTFSATTKKLEESISSILIIRYYRYKLPVI